jgi:hypothetical protein
MTRRFVCLRGVSLGVADVKIKMACRSEGTRLLITRYCKDQVLLVFLLHVYGCSSVGFWNPFKTLSLQGYIASAYIPRTAYRNVD